MNTDISPDRIIIGVTEGNDPAFNPSWFDRALNCDGSLVITKNLNEQVRNSVLMLYRLTHGRVMVHCTCTGFGGTVLEPNVPAPETQTEQLYQLIQDGFPADHAVFRIDPIVPTERGLALFRLAFDCLNSLNSRLLRTGSDPVTRVRVSLMDNYRHVSERFEQAGLPTLYGGEFYASSDLKASAKKSISEALSTATVPVSLELCAEDGFAETLGVVPHSAIGCLSVKDLQTMGFSEERIQATLRAGENAQCRQGCHCISCKRELIPAKGRCGHQCLYCYWRDPVSKEVEGQLSF